MIKIFIISTFLSLLNPDSTDLMKMRGLFLLISKSKESTLELMTLSKDSKSTHLLIKKAYNAAAEMALAKFKFNPISKSESFNLGKKKLDQTILSDSTLIEIRFIRFAIQCQAPIFLGYTNNINNDKAFILKNIQSLKAKDLAFFLTIFKFLIKSDKLNNYELKKIHSFK